MQKIFALALAASLTFTPPALVSPALAQESEPFFSGSRALEGAWEGAKRVMGAIPNSLGQQWRLNLTYRKYCAPPEGVCSNSRLCQATVVDDRNLREGWYMEESDLGIVYQGLILRRRQSAFSRSLADLSQSLMVRKQTAENLMEGTLRLMTDRRLAPEKVCELAQNPPPDFKASLLNGATALKNNGTDREQQAANKVLLLFRN